MSKIYELDITNIDSIKQIDMTINKNALIETLALNDILVDRISIEKNASNDFLMYKVIIDTGDYSIFDIDVIESVLGDGTLIESIIDISVIVSIYNRHISILIDVLDTSDDLRVMVLLK